MNKNGRVTKINANFCVNNLCVSSTLPTGCINPLSGNFETTVNDTYVPIETSIGEGAGIVWANPFCKKVWTPSRGVITIGL